MKRLIIKLTLLLTIASQAYASAGIGDKINFSLPDLNYSKFFSEDDFNNKPITVFAFIDDKCLPCLREMKFLKKYNKYYKNFEFVLIGTSYRKETKEFIKKANISEKDFTILNVADNKNPRKLLRRFNNKTYSLPFSVAIKKDKTICYSGVAGLNHKKLKEINKKCQ